MTGWMDYLFVRVKGHSSQVGIVDIPRVGETCVFIYQTPYLFYFTCLIWGTRCSEWPGEVLRMLHVSAGKTQSSHLKVLLLINVWVRNYSFFLPCRQIHLVLTSVPTVGERHSEEHEVGHRQHSAARRSQPNGRHAGDRDEPPDAHSGADAQTQRGRGQGNKLAIRWSRRSESDSPGFIVVTSNRCWTTRLE